MGITKDQIETLNLLLNSMFNTIEDLDNLDFYNLMEIWSQLIDLYHDVALGDV